MHTHYIEHGFKNQILLCIGSLFDWYALTQGTDGTSQFQLYIYTHTNYDPILVHGWIGTNGLYCLI